MRRKFDQLLSDLIGPPQGVPRIDFAAPLGAPALFAPDSITWRVMKNPVALFIGGVAAVLLELAEPRVRTGVWDFTRFRDDPLGRIRRTGYAALVTTYAPAEAARALIARVNLMHGGIAGFTATDVPFRASDPELLDWVQATAGFGFCEAYHTFVRPLSLREKDRFYAEGAPIAALYGASGAPRSEAEREDLFLTMRPKLEASPIVFEFLAIMRAAPLFPAPLNPLQNFAIKGAVSILPAWARDILKLGRDFTPPLGSAALLRQIGRVADHIILSNAPPAQSAKRVGLSPRALYSNRP